jgi:hypothetical protein
MHCWCPPATGPNQPHRDDCSRYKRPAKYIPLESGPYQSQLSVMQAQAYNHALQWLAKRDVTPLAFVSSLGRTTGTVDMDGEQISVASLIIGSVKCNEGCTCAARVGVIGHAAFCPLGDGTAPEGNAHSETV